MLFVDWINIKVREEEALQIKVGLLPVPPKAILVNLNQYFLKILKLNTQKLVGVFVVLALIRLNFHQLFYCSVYEYVDPFFSD